jgi:ATP/maltotriose-dependent transcriptional regulator MalT
MAGADSLQTGLTSLEQGRWAEADGHLTDVQAGGDLAADVLERLAVARLMIGRQEAGEECLVAAHESYLRADDRPGAARCAFWLGLMLVMRAEMARGGGWIGRAHEVLATHDECAEHGLLLLSAGLHAMGAGQADEAEATFARAREVGERHHAPDVVALGTLGLGQSLVRRGATAEGLAVLDRVMAGVEAEALSPLVTGIAYCAVIEECQRVFDVARAREWTSALSRWLGSQPDLVAFQGQCMVYRAEVVQRHGDWPAAADESRRARDRLSAPPGHPATGLALYRLGELHRLRGELDEAEVAYVEANRWGHSPQPGLALLRFDQGHVDRAAATIRRVLTEVTEPASRCGILAAAVTILVADGDLDGARHAAEELTQLAADVAAPFLQALADHCRGCLAMAEGELADAAGALRSCLQVWLELQAPHEEALTRAALGAAYRGLGDGDAAQLELDVARTLLEGLGAAPDLARLDTTTAATATAPATAAGALPELSLRELQVLRLVATGATNRAIADALYISVRTVDRHVSNLYTKLGVSTRAAATACAYERQLI